MKRLPPISAPGVHGKVARVADLVRAGVPIRRLYASDKVRPIYGVVSASGVDPLRFDTRVAAARLLMREGTFLSRRTAARILGIPVDKCDDTIDVGGIWPLRASRRSGLCAHQVRASAFLKMPSAPAWLPAPAEVWALLAGVTTVDGLVVAGDFLVSGATRWADPLCAFEDLEGAFERFNGCAGSPRLRQALPLVRAGVESPAETLLRLQIVRAGLPEPETSCLVQVADRDLRSDLGYKKWKIAIEYEGEYHFTGGLEQARRDTARYEEMQDAGWRVLRATALDLRDSRQFTERLRRVIQERAR